MWVEILKCFNVNSKIEKVDHGVVIIEAFAKEAKEEGMVGVIRL